MKQNGDRFFTARLKESGDLGFKHAMDIGTPLPERAYGGTADYDAEDRLTGLISPPKLSALRGCDRRMTSGTHAKHLLGLD